MSCSLEGATEPNNCKCGNVERSDVIDGVYTIESRNDCTSEVKTFIVTKEKFSKSILENRYCQSTPWFVEL